MWNTDSWVTLHLCIHYANSVSYFARRDVWISLIIIRTFQRAEHRNSRKNGTIIETDWAVCCCRLCFVCKEFNSRFWDMAAAIASGLIRQKRQAREQHIDRPATNRRRKSPNKNKGLCNGNLVDIFSKVRIFGLKKRRLRRQGVGSSIHKKSMLCLMSWDNIRPHFICTFGSDNKRLTAWNCCLSWQE